MRDCHRKAQEQTRALRDWHGHNGAQRAKGLSLGHKIYVHITPPLLPCHISCYNSHPFLYCCSGLIIINKTDDHFRRQHGPVELPQFSAGVSLAAAAAERGQGRAS